MSKPTNHQILFAAGETVRIEGIERDCDCSNCGRPLKVGIKLAGHGGFFGADCLSKAIGGFEVYGGRNVKLAADTIKTRAIVAHKGADYAWKAYGWKLTDPLFNPTLQNPLVWIW